MRWRFEITDPNGTVYQMSEPDGYLQGIIGLTRHPVLNSLVREYKSGLRAYGSNGTQDGLRDTIKQIEALFGPDCKIIFTTYWAVDNFNFTLFESSEIGIQTISEGLDFDHYLEFTPVQTGMWRKAMSSWDTPVNIQSALKLDGSDVDVITGTDLRLTSQVIDRTTSYDGHTGDTETAEDCLVATTSNVVLSGIQTVDGELGFTGRRIGVIANTDQKENGIYVEDVGAWTRAADANTDPEIEVLIFRVVSGTVNAGKVFKQQTDPVTIGVSNIVFAEYNYVDDVVLHSEEHDDVENGEYFTIYLPATADLDQEEIISSFATGFIAVEDSLDLTECIELSTTESGAIEVDLSIDYKFRGTVDIGGPVGAKIQLFYQINDETPVQIGVDDDASAGSGDVTNAGNFTASFVFQDGADDRIFNQGDRIKLYIAFGIAIVTISPINNVNFDYYGGITNQSVIFKFKSRYSDTTIKSFLLHDVCASVLDRITDSDKFYSELLGSQNTLARVYPEAGCYWNNMLSPGVHVRGYTLAQKLYSISMKQIFEGLHPHINLWVGYETVTIDSVATEVIRLEERTHGYDASSMSVLLSGVQRIRRKYSDQYYNSVETGISKGTIENISGIDDPQKQTRANVFTNIGRKLTLLSTFITQSLTWEDARRTIITKSKDYKYDNDHFMVEVTLGGSGYVPRLDEDYDSVTGLLNESTRYNKRWTPARMFVRWSNMIFAGCQNYVGTFYRFVSGEGNYDATSERKPDDCSDNYDGAVLAENADIPITTNKLYIPILFEIEHYLTIEEFNTIDANRNKAIGISQNYEDGSHAEFFIDPDLQYEIATGQVKIQGYFKDPFDIITVPPGGQIFQGGQVFDATFDHTFE